MPKNLDKVLKQYESLKKCVPPTIQDHVEGMMIPNEEAIDHTTDYVHTGSFEWYDEKLGRSLDCNRSANFKVALSKDSYAFDFNAWPRKLQINFLPKIEIKHTYQQLLDTKRLFFHLHPKDTSDIMQLLDRFKNDMVGDIVLPYNAETMAKRIICVFIPHRRILIGAVPNDQREFAVRLESITKTLKLKKVRNTSELLIIGGYRGPYGTKFFRFRIHFCRKAPTSEVHAPPTGNPGSATVNIAVIV